MDGLNELIDGGGVEKYVSFGFFCGKLWGDMGPAFIKSWNPGFPSSMANGLVIRGGPIMDCCHIEAEEAAGLFDPSNITSLMPLWLAVLIAEGEDPSIAFSLPSCND